MTGGGVRHETELRQSYMWECETRDAGRIIRLMADNGACVTGPDFEKRSRLSQKRQVGSQNSNQ